MLTVNFLSYSFFPPRDRGHDLPATGPHSSEIQAQMGLGATCEQYQVGGRVVGVVDGTARQRPPCLRNL